MQQFRNNVIRAGLEALYFTGAHYLLRPIFSGVGAIFMLHHVRPRRDAEFQPNRHLEVTPEKDGPVAVGSVFNTSAHQFGTQREKSTVTDLEAGKLFGWDSTGALGKVHHWFALSGNGGSTEVTKGLELVQPSFLAKMMGWKIARDSPKGLRADLEKIKASVEGSATA